MTCMTEAVRFIRFVSFLTSSRWSTVRYWKDRVRPIMLGASKFTQ